MTKALDLSISIPIEWTRVELVRKAVGFCVYAVYGRGDLRDSISMVSAELLENAMKYAPPDGMVHYALFHERTPAPEARSAPHESEGLVVTVKSGAPKGSRHVDALRERIAWIERFPSPAEAYMAALAEVFEHKEGQGEGGLGLVRIAYEGGCKLSCNTSEPGVVLVRAARPLIDEPEPSQRLARAP
jgi:hypothetical protein